ncbi:MAG TPA: hypothetical protein VFA18_11290, partial [Gemmataceae bacterium]|nr:hypothetical protein [Gemmataceae bacterium]
PVPHPAPAEPPMWLAQAASAEEPTALSSRQALEEQVLRWGVDALPESTPSLPKEPPLTLQSLLGLPAKPEQHPSLFHLGSWFQEGDRS